MSGPRQAWLMKSEPDVYSIADLKRDGRTAWTGVRNYQARNFMRDRMRVGDPVLFYHSNADPSGVAGVGRVAGPAYADPTQFDPAGDYFDPRATPAAPVWFLVDIAFVAALLKTTWVQAGDIVAAASELPPKVAARVRTALERTARETT